MDGAGQRRRRRRRGPRADCVATSACAGPASTPAPARVPEFARRKFSPGPHVGPDDHATAAGDRMDAGNIVEASSVLSGGTGAGDSADVDPRKVLTETGPKSATGVGGESRRRHQHQRKVLVTVAEVPHHRQR